MPSSQQDILIKFYLAVLKVQAYESQYLKISASDEIAPTLAELTRAARRELGAVTFSLLNAALPSCVRQLRLFRLKYIAEVDIPDLEVCLISAAYKVLANTDISNPQYDFRSAQPSALEFLDTLGNVQTICISIVESTLADLKHPPQLTPSPTTLVELARSTSTETAKQGDRLPSPSSGGHLEQSETSGDDRQTETVDPNGQSDQPVFQPSPPIRSKRKPTSNSTATNTPTTTTSISTSDYASSIQTTHINIPELNYTSTIHLPPASLLMIVPELYDNLIELDRHAATFEFELASCLSQRMRTVQEADDVQIVTVLFSDTLMWALAVRLLSADQLADRDPSVLVCLPRLAVLVGCRLLPDCFMGTNSLATGQRLPFMFSSSRAELAYLSRQLHALRLDQFCRLARWLGPRGLPNLVYTQSVSAIPPAQAPPDPDRPQSPDRISQSSKITIYDLSQSDSNAPVLNHPTSPQPQAQLHSNRLTTNNLSMSWNTPNNNNNRVSKSHRVWKTQLMGLHKLYKSISSVADQFANEHPTELRCILQKAIEMHDNPTVDQDLPGGADQVLDSDSEETELEQELNLDLTKLDRQFKLKKLVDLMDWPNVIRRRRQSHACLTQALKQSGLWISKYPDSDASDQTGSLHHSSLVRDFLGGPKSGSGGPSVVESIKKTSLCHSPLVECDSPTQPGFVEVGLDVATCLTGPDIMDLDAGAQEQTLVDSLSNEKLPKCDSCKGSAQLTARLNLLNLGTELEGISCADERLFNYLPPWQPDRIPMNPDQNRSNSKPTDDNDDDGGAESDDSTDPYVVGRQCASCLRSFNLIRRRHHCRRCGHIFCSNCCNHWQPIEGLATTKPVRICSECHDFLNAEP